MTIILLSKKVRLNGIHQLTQLVRKMRSKIGMSMSIQPASRNDSSACEVRTLTSKPGR